jgi:hypothetical protein
MNEKPEMSSGLDETALAARLKIAELDSTDEYGVVNHSWLVLHIWLAQCDMVRSDQLRRNSKDMPRMFKPVTICNIFPVVEFVCDLVKGNMG